MSRFIGNPEDRFSRVEVQMKGSVSVHSQGVL